MTNEEALHEAHEAVERLCRQIPPLPVRPIVVDSDVLMHNLCGMRTPPSRPQSC
jgi:hypothetical protein